MIGGVQGKIKIASTFPENEACDQLLCCGQTLLPVEQNTLRTSRSELKITGCYLLTHQLGWAVRFPWGDIQNKAPMKGITMCFSPPDLASETSAKS